jgi:hypothetical protein
MELAREPSFIKALIFSPAEVADATTGRRGRLQVNPDSFTKKQGSKPVPPCLEAFSELA